MNNPSFCVSMLPNKFMSNEVARSSTLSQWQLGFLNCPKWIMKSVIFNPFWFLLFLADNFLPFRDLRNIGLFGELKTLNRLLVPF